MDFELKHFFKRDSPRFQQELKESMHAFASDFVRKIIDLACSFRVKRILPRHVWYLIFHLCPDPCIYSDRAGVQINRSRVKDISKILASVLVETEEILEDKKNGHIERKIIKGVSTIAHEANCDISQKASVLIAACVSEVCGIILNSAYHAMKMPKTLTEAIVWEYATTHILSKQQEECVNKSLLRLIVSIKRQPVSKVAEKPTKVERTRFEVQEEKSVSFSNSTTRRA